MPMLIWNAGGAPPSGPGTAMSVVAATWFQWETSLPSVPLGGAADTPTAPTSSEPMTAGMNTTDRRRDVVALVEVWAWLDRAMASSSAPSSVLQDRRDAILPEGNPDRPKRVNRMRQPGVAASGRRPQVRSHVLGRPDRTRR